MLFNTSQREEPVMDQLQKVEISAILAEFEGLIVSLQACGHIVTTHVTLGPSQTRQPGMVPQQQMRQVQISEVLLAFSQVNDYLLVRALARITQVPATARVVAHPKSTFSRLKSTPPSSKARSRSPYKQRRTTTSTTL
jgi:hypothetical protein